MQPHKIIVHYHGDGGQMCSSEKTEAMLNDHEGILRLFKLIQDHQSYNASKSHFCRNGGIEIEIVPFTRGYIDETATI